MEITGRIYTIHQLSETQAQIVLKKTNGGKQVLLAIDIFGGFKKTIDEMKLKKNDKISGKLYFKSTLYNGRFKNNLYFLRIEKVENKPKNTFVPDGVVKPKELFEEDISFIDEEETNIIDEETGEILL
jgi:hypothetical protein